MDIYIYINILCFIPPFPAPGSNMRSWHVVAHSQSHLKPKEELQSKLSAAEQSGDLQRQEQLALEAHPFTCE